MQVDFADKLCLAVDGVYNENLFGTIEPTDKNGISIENRKT